MGAKGRVRETARGKPGWPLFDPPGKRAGATARGECFRVLQMRHHEQVFSYTPNPAPIFESDGAEVGRRGDRGKAVPRRGRIRRSFLAPSRERVQGEPRRVFLGRAVEDPKETGRGVFGPGAVSGVVSRGTHGRPRPASQWVHGRYAVGRTSCDAPGSHVGRSRRSAIRRA